MEESRTKDRRETLEGGRSLMLSVATLLTTVSATPAKAYQPPKELGERLRDGAYLGPGGFAFLLLRDVESGVRWHDGRGAGGDGLPPAVRPIECPLLPAVRLVDRDPAAVARAVRLRGWWQARRNGEGGRLRGVAVRQGEDYWVRDDGEYVAAAQDDLAARADQIPWLSRLPARSPGQWRTDVIASWSAWRDDAGGLLGIDVYAEEHGLCVGALVLEVDPASPRPARDLFDALIASAWDVARIALRQYWIFWDRVHTRSFLRAVNDRTPSPDFNAAINEGTHRHDGLLEHVAGSLKDLLRLVGHAFQTPAVALLAPDTAYDVGVIGHVGYQVPGKPFRLSSEYRGLSHYFCLYIDPIIANPKHAALQLATPADVEKAYELFHLDGLQRDAGPDEPRSEIEQRIHEDLRAGARADHAPRVLRGPWAYANVELDQTFWSEPLPAAASVPSEGALAEYGLSRADKKRPSGLLRIQGRIPCQLDLPDAPPPLTGTELRRLHLWARTIALVLHRLLRAHERRRAASLVAGATQSLPDLQHFTGFLRTELGAAGIVVLAAQEAHFEAFDARAQSFDQHVGEARERIVAALANREVTSTDGRDVVPAEGGVLRGFVPCGPRHRLNCVWIPISTAGVLAVVGAPPELPAHVDGHAAVTAAGWLEERSRAFPHFLDGTLTTLRHLLHVRMAAAAPFAAPANAEAPESQRRSGRPRTAIGTLLVEKVMPHYRDPESPRCQAAVDTAGALLAQWVKRARATWPHKEDFTDALGYHLSTLTRTLDELRAVHVIQGGWVLLKEGPRFKNDAEALAALEPIAQRLQNLPPFPTPPPPAAPTPPPPAAPTLPPPSAAPTLPPPSAAPTLRPVAAAPSPLASSPLPRPPLLPTKT